MHPAPTISVILPAYNVAPYIDQAARSILAQTFTDFELIIIDDASTDQTPNKIRALATDSPRIKIITNARNLGIPKTRNIGAAAARGKYIAVQDGDDISLPTRLAEQVAYLEAHPDIALLGTARLRMSADSNINYNSGRLLSTRSVAKSPDGKTARPTFDDLLHANHFVHGSVMMRRNVFDEVGGYDETFALYEDYDLWLRIAKRYTVANLLQPLYALRSHPASVTKQNAANALLFQHLVVNRAKGEVDEATLAEIRAHGIEKYYECLTPAGKIRYHKSLANTCYRNKQWHNALCEYHRLKELGGVMVKAKAYWRLSLIHRARLTRRWRSEAVKRPNVAVELSSRQYRSRMFGDSERCKCNNQGKCPRGNACYYQKAKAALKRAHEIRQFEIELLWKRAAYVATFQTLLFAALGLSFRAEAGHPVIVFQIVTCVAGVFSAFFWRLINKGSKFWHENWTYHIDFLENEFEGKLHKTVLYSGNDYKSKAKSLNAKTQPYSVSRVNIAISNLFGVAWLGLLFALLLKLFAHFGDMTIPVFAGKEWPILLAAVSVIAVVLCAVIFCCNRRLKSKFDDADPKKDVRWARRELPFTVGTSSGVEKND